MSTVLKTYNLNKKYGNKLVSNNISLTINKGDIYGFVGKNGAGKTTLMRQVLGMAFPTDVPFSCLTENLWIWRAEKSVLLSKHRLYTKNAPHTKI